MQGVLTMKRLIPLLLITPALAVAAGPFDGTWVWDPASVQLPDKPDVFTLDKGMYDCTSCVPVQHLKADGTDQPSAAGSISDTISVKVVDVHTVVLTRKKAGKVLSIDELKVSADGKTLVDRLEDRTEGTPVTSRATSMRVAAGPAGAHAASGSWKTTKIDSVSANGLELTMKTTATGISIRDPNGGGYDAGFDGKEVAALNDATHTMVSVKRIDARTIEETDRHSGKVDSVGQMSVSADGKTMFFSYENKRNGTTTKSAAHRKS
jgi:hypothetical protein